MNENNTAQRIWTPLFINAFVINVLVHICTYMMNTLSATYANYLGATPTVVGLVTGLFALTALLFKVIAAPALDSFKRKYVLIASIIILLSSFVCYSLAQTVPLLIVARLLTGAGLAFLTTGCLTIASDALPIEKMSTGIGYFTLGSAACQAVAPSIGLALVSAFGYTTTFSILAVVMLLVIVYAFTMKMDSKPANTFRITVQSVIAKEALLPACILFFLSMAFSNINAFLVLFGNLAIFGSEQASGSEMGLFFTVYAVAMIFTRPLIGKLADRFGTVKIVVPSMLCFAASFLLISLSRTLPMFLLTGLVSAFGYGGCQPAIMAVCMKSVPKERRGAASCTSYVGNDLGNLAGPALAGTVVSAVGGASKLMGYVTMWQVMIIPIVVAIIFSLVFREKINHAGDSFKETAVKIQEEAI